MDESSEASISIPQKATSGDTKSDNKILFLPRDRAYLRKK